MNFKDKGMGAIPSPIDVRNYVATCAVSAEEFPETFELELTAIKDQGHVGSCVAHSLATIVEYFDKAQGDNVGQMSTGYLYGLRSNGYTSRGMIMSWACKDLLKYGLCSYKKFPENVEVPHAIELSKSRLFELYPEAYLNRVSSYFALDGMNSIKATLMSGSPVLFSIEWYDDIIVDSDGVLHSNYVSSGSYHAMVIYGWDNRGWKIQNSWGTDWGIDGRGILPYSFPRRETWGFTDTYSENLRNMEINRYKEHIALLNDQLANQQVELDKISEDYYESVRNYENIVIELANQKEVIKQLKGQIKDKENEQANIQEQCQNLKEVIQDLRRQLNEDKESDGESIRALEELIAQKQHDLDILLTENDELMIVIRDLNSQLKAERENKSKLESEDKQHKQLQSLYEDTLDQLEQTKEQLKQEMSENEQLEKKLLEIDQPFSSPLGQAIAKVINCLLNLFTRKQ